jgi:hypothetical protein
MRGSLSTWTIILAVATSSGLADDKPPFKFTTKHDKDRVEAKVEKDKATLSVHSSTGIGHVIIERTGDKWPDALVMRMHLSGLEHFQATNDKVAIDASVLSYDGYRRLIHLRKGDKEGPLLDARSPYWMEIRMLGVGGKPKEEIPQSDGYFEMQLPKVFFEGNPKSIKVDWIDFYRV